jgi:Ni/Fe-hydrogenase 1 B-type cytochrome subunit
MKKTHRIAGSEASWKDPSPGQVRVYVWEWPVRFSHWIIIATIISLSITGYYMHAPYNAPGGHSSYVMGTMRFVHIVSAFFFTGAVLLRLLWFFLGNQWANWRQFIPTTKERWQGLKATGKYYTFRAWSPIPYVGHNPLAGAAYAVVYAMAIVEIITGLVLYSKTLGSSTLNFFVGWIPRIIDIQWLREIHFLIMFGFWAFFIHHIYTAILVAVEEQNGIMESIFSGYKFIPEEELRKELLSEDAALTAQPAAASEEKTPTSV